MTNDAISSLEQAIQIHEQIIQKEKTAEISMVSPNSMIPAELERSEVMKMLAEELIKAQRIQEGIEVARKALQIQQNFFQGMVVNNVQEHMLLLAEALTVDKQVAEALELYEQILDARNQSGEPTIVWKPDHNNVHRLSQPT